MGGAYHNTEKEFNPSQNIIGKLYIGMKLQPHLTYGVKCLHSKQPFSQAEDCEQFCYMSGKHFCGFSRVTFTGPITLFIT